MTPLLELAPIYYSLIWDTIFASSAHPHSLVLALCCLYVFVPWLTYCLERFYTLSALHALHTLFETILCKNEAFSGSKLSGC